MKGSYLLLLKIKKPLKIKIGSLGLIKFQKGNYIYVGSALNSLENRIKRHFKKTKKKHWHIDYLTTNKNVKILKAVYKISNKKLECKIAKRINKLGKPIEKFGSSDCKCKGHLFKIKDFNQIKISASKVFLK